MRVAALICLLLLCSPVTAAPAVPDLLVAAGDTGCQRVRLSGLCLWWHCTVFSCQLRSSLQWSHYRPDLVVTAHNGRSPWRYAERLTRALPSSGGGHRVRFDGSQSTLRFKRVELIGSPATALRLPGLCPSTALPWHPYYLSGADWLGWRLAIPEQWHPDAVLPGRRRIGLDADSWGAIYPRHGFALQSDDRKMAAVVAQRAADIVTRRDQSRVYRHAGGSCGRGCQGPGPLRENDATSGLWQQLIPTRGECRVFGGEPDGPVAEDGGYAWHLWRPYRCCRPRGQRLLTVIDFGMAP